MYLDTYKKCITMLQGKLKEEGYTEEDLKVDKFIFGYFYKIRYIVALICFNLRIWDFLVVLLCFGAIIFGIVGLISKSFCIIALAMFLGILEVLLVFTRKKMNEYLLDNQEEFMDNMTDKLLNIYALNPLVISYNNWRKIKKASKTNYKKIRSKKSITKCYETTFYIANILRKKEIKIMWLLNHTFQEKYGHAVLVRKNMVYDTNRRKTYPKAEYLKFNKSEIYKEFSLDEYLFEDIDRLITKGIDDSNLFKEKLKLDWEEFKVFCNQRGGIRSNSDNL